MIKVLYDSNQNKLLIEKKGDKISLHLKLSDNSRKRLLGKIDKAKKIFYVKRKREKHLFRKNNSYGFNHKILEEAKLFDKVMLTDNFGSYLIPKDDILKHGNFLYFMKQGFELQIILGLDIINQYKV